MWNHVSYVALIRLAGCNVWWCDLGVWRLCFHHIFCACGYTDGGISDLCEKGWEGEWSDMKQPKWDLHDSLTLPGKGSPGFLFFFVLEFNHLMHSFFTHLLTVVLWNLHSAYSIISISSVLSLFFFPSNLFVLLSGLPSPLSPSLSFMLQLVNLAFSSAHLI